MTFQTFSRVSLIDAPVACLCEQEPEALVSVGGFSREMGMRHAMELAMALMDANTHLHVSLDVDFLDPDIAPGVGTAVRGGPSYRTAALAVDLVEGLFGKSTLMWQ